MHWLGSGPGQHLKLSAIYWSVPAATDILTLECQKASGRWEKICQQPYDPMSSADIAFQAS